VARIGTFTVVDDLASGQLVPLLEAYNPDDREPIHAVFVGGRRCRRGCGCLWIFW
jgi:DNA-binding transcriptional LysR family regulator